MGGRQRPNAALKRHQDDVLTYTHVIYHFEVFLSCWIHFWHVLAALTQFWAATFTRKHLNMAEMDSATQKKRNNISHVCMPKKSSWGRIWSLGGLRLEKCRFLVLKCVGTWGLWIIIEGMKSISQKIWLGPPHHKKFKSSMESFIALVLFHILIWSFAWRQLFFIKNF